MTTKEYNQLVDLQSDSLYRFLVKQCRNTEKAKDITQEAFARLWENRGVIDSEKAKSYLFSTAYHFFIDEIRKNKRTEFTDKVPENRDVANHAYSDLQEILHQAISLLPENQQSVVLLRDYEGYSYEEIAQITGLNVSQVKVYIYRARVFLRKYIGSIETVA